MTEKEIVAIIGKDRIIAGHPLVCPNVSHLLPGQLDMISVNKKGMLIEYEIKTSVKDFRRDAGKRRSVYFDKPEIHFQRLPNHFYYVVPAQLISSEDVPAWAGLIWIDLPFNGSEHVMIQKKKAPTIHKHQHDLGRVVKKALTLYQQRQFLGCCLLTYENKGITERNKERLRQYEEQAAKNTEAILNFKK